MECRYYSIDTDTNITWSMGSLAVFVCCRAAAASISISAVWTKDVLSMPVCHNLLLVLSTINNLAPHKSHQYPDVASKLNIYLENSKKKFIL